MKSRQRGAIAHPIPHGQTGTAPHKNRVENLGSRVTILTVIEAFPEVWVWHASMSFRDSRAPDGDALVLGLWKQEHADKADRQLQNLLSGVGDEVVFGVRPVHVKLPSWEVYGLEAWNVINDGDAVAHIAPTLGTKLPCPPSQFKAMHLWKTLTEDEIGIVHTNLKKQR